jgi:hypothetical protein
MRPKSKVSDWLAKKSEDGSDAGEQSSEEEQSDEERSASGQEDGDTDDEDDREFDIELVERKVLRSRPADRIQYMKNELHERVSCELPISFSRVCYTNFIVNAFSLVTV